MGTIVSFTGPSAAGKTTLVERLLADGALTGMISSTTTRRPRPTDLQHEYAYVDQEQFRSLEDRKLFLWAVGFDTNWYGTTRTAVLDAVSMRGAYGIILVPSVIPTLRECSNAMQIPLFITADESLRRTRMLARGDNRESVERRIATESFWELDAEASDIPYLFFKNNKAVDALAVEIAAVIRRYT